MTPPVAAAPLPCRAETLSVALDDENGSLNGMSHGGTLLVVRNLGPTACVVPGRPQLSFTDKDGKPQLLILQVPPGMHPGPVIVPVVIPAGAEATAGLRWVSGEVYDHSVCVQPAFVRVEFATGAQRIPFDRRVCGPAGGPPSYTQPLLLRDPVWTAKP